MALLDFKCEECGEKFSELTKIENIHLLKCPKCDSKAVKQVFEGKSFFGGSGKSGASIPHRGG